MAQDLHSWMDCFLAVSLFYDDSGPRKVGAREKSPGPEISGLQACMEACHCCSDYRASLGQGSSAHQEREENMKTALGCGKTFVFDPAEASNFGAEVAGACAKTMHNRMDLMPEPWILRETIFWQLAGLGVAWCGGG